MSSRLERLRERTNGYTVTAQQYVYFAYAALIALTLIVLTGAAVRLTGSGLGCPTWPKCYGNVYPPLNSHAVIEFSNRVLTAPVSIAAGLAWVAALRRRPYRRDLAWLSGLLPLGVVGQAVLGGFTVRGELDYGWVMGHFALSMLILVAAVVLVWRSAASEHETRAAAAQPAARAAGQPADRTLVWSVRALVALGALTIFAGTAATAAGPHAGGSPGQKINRLSFDGRGTMDFVIHRHAEIAFVFSLAAVAVWWLARRRSAAPGAAAAADGDVRAARPAGGRGARSVRDASADGARVGARGAGLRGLDRDPVGGVRGRPPAAAHRARGGPAARRRLAGGRLAAQVPRKLGLLRGPNPVFCGRRRPRQRLACSQQRHSRREWHDQERAG